MSDLVQPFEQYRPRAVRDIGVWPVGTLRLKVYGIVADGKALSGALIGEARDFVEQALPELVAAEGDDNGLGFVIIHPGDRGVSVLAQWWVQGSVLCQTIRRRLYGAERPLDMASRPVIACVWELGLIEAEQRLWRETMMGAKPSPSAYLAARTGLAAV